MKVLGMGIIFNRGRGGSALRDALRQGWQPPLSEVQEKGRSHPVYQVPTDVLQDRAVLKGMRRADRLSKMAVIAASDALADSELTEIDRRRTGVIVATGCGAHVTTFDFLDGILDFGEAAVSPTAFSNSVHNAAASYISSALGVQGPTLTVTQFLFSFQGALQLAGAWLREGSADHVLVGAVDQCGEVMAYIANAKLGIARDGKIRPFASPSTQAVPGEGAVFFLVSRNGDGRPYCEVKDVRFGVRGEVLVPAELTIFDADGMVPDELSYASHDAPAAAVAAYSPLWGSMMIGSAFSCAAGALMLRDQVRYASPVPAGSDGLNVLSETFDYSVELIQCVRYNCSAENAVILLQKCTADRPVSP